jgi:hypothetical protein
MLDSALAKALRIPPLSLLAEVETEASTPTLLLAPATATEVLPDKEVASASVPA